NVRWTGCCTRGCSGAPPTTKVEIAHEALVRNWPRLADWVQEQHAMARRRLQVEAAWSRSSSLGPSVAADGGGMAILLTRVHGRNPGGSALKRQQSDQHEPSADEFGKIEGLAEGEHRKNATDDRHQQSEARSCRCAATGDGPVPHDVR